MPENKWPSLVYIYTDGASRGNPGPASVGIYVTDADQQVVAEVGEALGSQTNNFAEYTAVKRALQLALANGARTVVLRSDSELLIRQMTGIYKVKSPVIIPLYDECKKLTKQFERIAFEHVRREFNRDADRLANQALDNDL